MRYSTVLPRLLSALVLVAFGLDAHATEDAGQVPAAASERCAVLAGDDAGKVRVYPVASLQVHKITAAGDFSLPDDAPKGTQAVFCARRSILPSANDYKVPKAGFPLYVVAPDERKAVLEIIQGRIQYRAVDGEFSPEEARLVEALLNLAQKRLAGGTQP